MLCMLYVFPTYRTLNRVQVPPQRFLFEAVVDGDALSTPLASEEEERSVDESDHEAGDSGPALAVADLNGVVGGGRFWSAASEIGFFSN